MLNLVLIINSGTGFEPVSQTKKAKKSLRSAVKLSPLMADMQKKYLR